MTTAERSTLVGLLVTCERANIANAFVDEARAWLDADERGEYFYGIGERRCPACLDVPGKDGLGRTCKTCGGKGTVLAAS